MTKNNQKGWGLVETFAHPRRRTPRGEAMKPTPQEPGFRRVVIDELIGRGGTFSYAVGLYDDRGNLRTTRTHANRQGAAREAFDWLDWSDLRPVAPTPLNQKRHQP